MRMAWRPRDPGLCVWFDAGPRDELRAISHVERRLPALIRLPPSPSLVRSIAGVALGAVAGWICTRLHTPIPWMLGPLVTIAALRVSNVDVPALPGGRQAGQWIIGTSLGLYFTPQVVRQVAGLWPSLVAGALFAIFLGYFGGLVLARLAGLDRTSAIFASVPGGAAEMAVLGERFGARVDKVSAAQSVRILVVVILLPALYTLSGVHGADAYVPGTSFIDVVGLASLLAATSVGGFIALRLRIPNAFVLGSLAVALPLTAMEVHLSAMPVLLSNGAQCLLGCALGSRFQPDFVHGAPRFMAATVLTSVLSIAVAALFGWSVAWASELYAPTVILGTAPGGIAEMCITAKVLQLGVPLVTSFQVVRIVVLLLTTAPLFGWTRTVRRKRRSRAER
jgi:membrane AbrB-like protein